MNTIDEQIEILQAYRDGKTIQVYQGEADGKPLWLDGANKHDENELACLRFDNQTYRIKPEPKYRAFVSVEEFWDEATKHKPFGWLMEKATGNRYLIDSFERKRSVFLSSNTGENRELVGYFKDFTFADGTPCGVEEE